MNVSCPLRVALAAAAALALTTGCAKDADLGGDGSVHVIASFYPLEYVTERIGGDHVDVTGLTKPGAEPHDLELTPRQMGSLSDADLVVYLRGLQPAVDEAVEQTSPARVSDAGKFAHAEEAGTQGDGEGDGHDHEGDPHLWLDPTLLARVAGDIGGQLAKADPEHSSDYRANTAGLVKDLKALDREFKDGLAHARTRTFITTHAAFGYLAERYHLKQYGISGLDPESEPSPARLAELQRTAKRQKVTTIFFETLASPKTARTLAKDLGLKTAVLDPLEGVKDPDKDTYVSVMRQNLRNLQSALGAS